MAGVVNQLRQDAREVVRELGLLKDAFFDIGVTLAERHLLIELSSLTCPTMKEIGERLLIEKSTTSRLIARAVKKGYVSISSDNDDKRCRTLHLTEHGKKTLIAFEKIAYKQTNDALHMLTPEEAHLVTKGVHLYAKGLRAARIGEKKVQESREYPLLDGYFLTESTLQDEEGLYEIFQEISGINGYFPNASTSLAEFQDQFFSKGSRVYVCKERVSGEVIGGFYLRPNFPGRGSHIVNAAYMVRSIHRGKGIGTKLVEASLTIAKELGYRAMQYNMVLSSNAKAIKLYKKLGFSVAGTIPDAIVNEDGSYQDGYILHRKFV